MANPIKDTDIFEGGIKKLQAEIDVLNKSLLLISETLTKVGTSAKSADLSKGSGVKQLNDDIKTIDNTVKQYTQTKTQLNTVEKRKRNY